MPGGGGWGEGWEEEGQGTRREWGQKTTKTKGRGNSMSARQRYTSLLHAAVRVGCLLPQRQTNCLKFLQVAETNILPPIPACSHKTQTSFCPLCIKVFLVSWNITFQPISWLFELAWGWGVCPNLIPIRPVAPPPPLSPVWVKCHWAVAFPVCLRKHIMYVCENVCGDKHDTFACQYSKNKKRRFCKDSFWAADHVCPHFFHFYAE